MTATAAASALAGAQVGGSNAAVRTFGAAVCPHALEAASAI